MPDEQWVSTVEAAMSEFAARHQVVYKYTKRQLAAAFEIGCFLLLVSDYEDQGFQLEINNTREGAYRYLTTPSGDPRNFSYVTLGFGQRSWQLRQQARIRSHIHADISTTPDIVVVESSTSVHAERDEDYAGGKRRLFYIDACDVVAAHECKSLPGYPELYVSFIGLLTVVHAWFDGALSVVERGENGHLAPTLFVGGDARNYHVRMIKALEEVFPVNIVTSVHRAARWSDLRRRPLQRMPLSGGLHDLS